jgi:hypothetical protein
MSRNLKPIEIAEGALLADVAVIFQLLVVYLPAGGDFFRLLIFVVFAVLVLRRGLYVGIMGMFTALFLIGVVTGWRGVFYLVLEATGGLFLGVTMRRNLRHIPLILLGTTCGTFAVYSLLFFFMLLAGESFAILLHALHSVYNALIALTNALAPQVGLDIWWKQSAFPLVSSIAAWSFTYWWVTVYIGGWLLVCPVVIAVYAFTNLFVRLLGHEVRPFPGGRLGRLHHRIARSIIKLGIKRGFIGKARVKI